MNTIIQGIEKLSPKDGDIIIIRAREGATVGDAVHLRDGARNMLRNMGLNAGVAIIGHDTDISHLDEDAMRAHGWVRAPQSDS